MFYCRHCDNFVIIGLTADTERAAEDHWLDEHHTVGCKTMESFALDVFLYPDALDSGVRQQAFAGN